MKELEINTTDELNYQLRGRVISNIYVNLTETKVTLFIQVGNLTLSIKPINLIEGLALDLGLFEGN